MFDTQRLLLLHQLFIRRIMIRYFVIPEISLLSVVCVNYWLFVGYGEFVVVPGVLVP